MEEKLKQFIGKKVHITFENKKYKGIYNLTGILLGADMFWAYFANPTSDYPESNFTYVNTMKIKSVEEVNNEKHR
jgi:hypothetical protein